VTALTPEHILDTAEDVLRRYGPDKATVVDVARALGVTHAAVYRHFPSKAALRAAVAERWLERAHEPLLPVLDNGQPPPERLRTWLHTLLDAKRRKVLDDPELFATYHVLAVEASEVVAEHVADLVRQVREILADGAADGYFRPGAPEVAQAVLDATTRFHHPGHAGEWRDEAVHNRLDEVCDLILSGLLVTRSRSGRARR